MEFFAKILKPLPIFVKTTLLDVCQYSKYTSANWVMATRLLKSANQQSQQLKYRIFQLSVSANLATFKNIWFIDLVFLSLTLQVYFHAGTEPESIKQSSQSIRKVGLQCPLRKTSLIKQRQQYEVKIHYLWLLLSRIFLTFS